MVSHYAEIEYEHSFEKNNLRLKIIVSKRTVKSIPKKYLQSKPRGYYFLNKPIRYRFYDVEESNGISVCSNYSKWKYLGAEEKK